MSSNETRNILGIIILVLIVTIPAVSYNFWQAYKDTKSTQVVATTSSHAEGEFVIVRGEVTSIDLSALQVDGNGIYKIKSDNGTKYTVHLTSGESNCAIYRQKPVGSAVEDGIIKGSKVEVRGISNGEDILQICESGTYIKLR